MKQKQTHRLRVFGMACLRSIEGDIRRDKMIRNEEMYSRLNIRCSIIDRIQSKRLRYFGHLTRMQDERYPKIACNGYVRGVRKRGRPKKPWIDVIREDCKALNMTIK